ncbi:HRQ family protein [Hirsutella rhossiliensis]|uniref:HRQ family protein n=1 Tax=Hirsutella rhossiliensis TaxID=111463 RepID=A0A9P8MXL5_9HYPO|nr:HRQ family protein [Hirsutella rhossiliensis]KAH0962857.1 HRQ family protein [Hirsutella rhossiliensis]
MAAIDMEYTRLGVTLGACGLAFLIYALVYGRKTPFPLLFLSRQRQSNQTSVAGLSKRFPPSQRALLAEVATAASSAVDGLDADFDLSTCPKLTLEIESDYRCADPATFLFSGFTVGEVRALGDFPDYAKLSGVPLPGPARDFNIDNALPRPYRPFRWPYHQTMSLQKLDTDYWLELEGSYRDRIRQRQALFAKHGRQVLQALPGSELARKELVEVVVQFLCARYPRHFQLVNGKTLVNRILETEHDLATAEPLHVLLDNVPEDFAIVLRHHETGHYCFRAGIICSAVGWNLGQKIGLSLSAIHRPVPDYKDKIEFSVDRFFSKMATFNPIQRASWGLEVGQPLYLPSTDPDFSHRESQNPSLRPEDIFFRVDWQTVRRLPLSGAVVFNFKALFTPLTEFEDEPYIPSLVLKVLNEGKENIMRYKGTWHVEHVAKPTLARYERLQVERGLIDGQWAPHTLQESPFFPGWERKCRLA